MCSIRKEEDHTSGKKVPEVIPRTVDLTACYSHTHMNNGTCSQEFEYPEKENTVTCFNSGDPILLHVYSSENKTPEPLLTSKSIDSP